MILERFLWKEEYTGGRGEREEECPYRRMLSPRPKWGSAWRCKGLISNEWMKPSAKRRLGFASQWPGVFFEGPPGTGRAGLRGDEGCMLLARPLSHSHPDSLHQSHQHQPTLRKYPSPSFPNPTYRPSLPFRNTTCICPWASWQGDERVGESWVTGLFCVWGWKVRKSWDSFASNRPWTRGLSLQCREKTCPCLKEAAASHPSRLRWWHFRKSQIWTFQVKSTGLPSLAFEVGFMLFLGDPVPCWARPLRATSASPASWDLMPGPWRRV